MRICDKCGVGYSGNLAICPLCGNRLEGSEMPAAFPIQEAKAPGNIALKLLRVCTLSAMGIAFVAALFAETHIWTVIFALVALLVNYLFLRNVVVHRPDFLRITERWFLSLLAITVLWWLATDISWISSVVIPGICIGASVVNTVLVASFRDTFVQGYAKYLIYDVVLGFVPLVFALAGWVDQPWVCYASAIFAVLLTCALLLLCRHQLKAEIKKLVTA